MDGNAWREKREGKDDVIYYHLKKEIIEIYVMCMNVMYVRVCVCVRRGQRTLGVLLYHPLPYFCKVESLPGFGELLTSEHQ